jgi:predicted dehydrogenase
VIRLATIGTSKITHAFLDAANGVPEVQVTTAYSRDPDRAEAFARAHGLPRTESNLTALLDSPDIDAVYIASPNSIHFGQALQAIRAGKHVLVEKPAVLTAADFTALMAAAEDHGVVVLEAMRNAYSPGFAAVVRLASNLGAIRRASFAYCQRSARYDKVLAGETVNIFDPALGGGALLDLGVYCISAMVAMFGEPDHAVAAAVPIRGGADGAGAALASYSGFVVDLSYSKITASRRPCEIQGELGTLEFDAIAEPTTATLTMLDGTVSAHHFPDSEHDMAHEVRRFAELIGGADQSSDHARTLATLRVVDALRGS